MIKTAKHATAVFTFFSSYFSTNFPLGFPPDAPLAPYFPNMWLPTPGHTLGGGVHIAEEEEDGPLPSYNVLITARPSPSCIGPPQACKMFAIVLLFQMGKWWLRMVNALAPVCSANPGSSDPHHLALLPPPPAFLSSRPQVRAYRGEIPAEVWGACSGNRAA